MTTLQNFTWSSLDIANSRRTCSPSNHDWGQDEEPDIECLTLPDFSSDSGTDSDPSIEHLRWMLKDLTNNFEPEFMIFLPTPAPPPSPVPPTGMDGMDGMDIPIFKRIGRVVCLCCNKVGYFEGICEECNDSDFNTDLDKNDWCLRRAPKPVFVRAKKFKGARKKTFYNIISNMKNREKASRAKRRSKRILKFRK